MTRQAHFFRGLNGVWTAWTANFIYPYNYQKLLDESLDEAVVACYNSSEEKLPVGEDIKVTITEDNTVVATAFYKISNDESTEYPVGSGKYKHTVSLVEATKYFEFVMGQTITFTNAVGRSYEQHEAQLTNWHEGTASTDVPFYLETYLSDFVSPTPAGDYTVKSVNAIAQSLCANWHSRKSSINFYPHEYTGQGYKSQCKYSTGGQSGTLKWGDAPVTLHNVSYEITLVYWIGISINNTQASAVEYQFTVRLALAEPSASDPSKKWTIASVVDRICDLAEPIYDNETPRFYLSEDDHTELEKILAPEFTISQATLREQLRVVGGRIHAEPRVKTVTIGAGKPQYEITFDYFNKHEKATAPASYIIKKSAQDISNYCTQLYTNARNIVSSLDGGAVRIEPGLGDARIYKGLRAENSAIRINDENGIIATDEPIYDLISVFCNIYERGNDVAKLPISADITKFCFEATEYDNLSSYSGTYPTSKAYALRWERGSRNITGLWFQLPDAISPALKRQAIVNILSVESGVSAATIEGYIAADKTQLVFNVSYKPVTNTAFIHGKNEYKNGEQYTVVYNQSDSLVELGYYGENIRGAVERLGNPEIILTAVYESYNDIPKVGKIIKYGNEDYYISSVSVEMTNNFYTASLSLSKNFNRLSQYIGINSEKRISEISTTQSYDREIVLRCKLVLGQRPAGGYPDSPIYVPITGFRRMFVAEDNIYPITQAKITRDGGLNEVVLPAMATGYGTTTVFTASMKDNYSAGQTEEWIEAGGIKGFWGKDHRFGDFYGRARTISVAFANAVDQSKMFAFNSPISSAATPSDAITANNYLCRKDSRERLATIAIAIEAQTTISGVTIGSGIAKTNAFVNGDMRTAKLYIIPNGSELPYKLDDTIIDYDRTGWVEHDITASAITDNYFRLKQIDAESDGIGFVVAMPVVEEQITVINESGQPETQTVYKGGEILFVGDFPITTGQHLLGYQYAFSIVKE